MSVHSLFPKEVGQDGFSRSRRSSSASMASRMKAADCECSHCGRELKVGVKLDGFGGHFGADCLCKATGKQTVRGITSKASADWLKQLALIAGRGREDAYGFSKGDAHFRFTLVTALQSN